MSLWDYLKKQEVSSEYEEAKVRIMDLHKKEESLAYIDWMSYGQEETEGEMQVEFVHGEMKKGEEIILYDCNGKKTGRVTILELYLGKNKNPANYSENGETGQIIFRKEEDGSDEFWRSQYAVGCE
ncbi:MAG TPA: hypothetical protein H9754_07460 [Candidatus Anaerostipes avistercoris]|uniref:Uncharacterized protein n=1 Tax=Candidatus Anaerostipes avistercoris TaxID=2838462 RepID=A0A9D2PHL6_9FIRM|nr:hypothetical protein [uncultured Anaerostipes sp.]HJC50389.1 hypothetical protein [Candidatus Anaerostipes avistercoris]